MQSALPIKKAMSAANHKIYILVNYTSEKNLDL